MFKTRPTERTASGWRRFQHRGALLALLGVIVGGVLGYSSPAAQAALQVGGNDNDMLVGQDNDNAANRFLQPEGVTAKQHLDNTDILLGGSGGDLMIGLLGDDVLHGEDGEDILIGGTESGQAPNSDVILGDNDNDINIWAPGDGSDAYLGGAGRDTHIFAPLVVDNNQPVVFNAYNRRIPHVTMDEQARFTCTIEEVPADRELDFAYITRFFVDGNLAVTVRLAEVERVFCTSPQPDHVLYADLTSFNPTRFRERPLSDFSDTLLGAIMQAP
jgi:hypothetical protein